MRLFEPWDAVGKVLSSAQSCPLLCTYLPCRHDNVHSPYIIKRTMLSLRAASSSSNARGRRRRSAAVSPAAALLLLRGVSVSGSNADNDDNAYRYRLFESRVITRSSTINDETAIDWAAFAAEINAIAKGDDPTTVMHTPSMQTTTKPTPLPTNSTIQSSTPPTSLPTTTTIQPTVKPTRLQINNVGNDGSPSEVFPLGLCQGDCDDDDECAGDLICHQRGRNDAVPGCAGGRNERDSTDYCILPPTASPTVSVSHAPSHQPTVSVAPSVSQAPSNEPSLSPTAKPTRLQINKVGNGGSPSEVFPLGLCQGDCDDDDECAGDLICYQRGRNEAVPGCAGGRNERDSTDYCILPPTASPTISHAPSQQPTISIAPSVSQAPSDEPSFSPTAKPTRLLINKVGNGGSPSEVFPLGLCQGDCDDDDECAGDLICYQRERNEAVPGCSGGQNERDNTDYCIPPPTASPSVSHAPSHQPSISAAPSVSFAPSDLPSFSPTQSPTMEASPPVRLRLHWTRSSRWQETSRETYWCLQCRSGSCRKNSTIEVDRCSRSSKRQRFQYYKGDRSFRPMTDPSLCFEENGWDSQSRPIKLKRCNGSSRQKWRGFKEKKGSPFEFKSGRNSKYCMTQSHHPRAHEKVFPQQCRRARNHKTSKWVVY